MIREGYEIKLRSEEGLILAGTVFDYSMDESLSVVTNEGDEFDFVAEGDEWKREGAYWHVVKSNPCIPCIGLNPDNPIAYGHLPTQEQDKLLGLMETSQRARVQLMDAEIRGDRSGAERWRSELRDVERKLSVAEQKHGPAFWNPASVDEIKEYAIRRWGKLSWRGPQDRDITWKEFAGRIGFVDEPGAKETAKVLSKMSGLVREFPLPLVNPRKKKRTQSRKKKRTQSRKKKRTQSRKKLNPKQRVTNVRSLVAKALK